jgi:hypothetical protein
MNMKDRTTARVTARPISSGPPVVRSPTYQQVMATATPKTTDFRMLSMMSVNLTIS